MNTNPTIRPRRRYATICSTVLLVSAFTAPAVRAQHAAPAPGWEVSVGVGAASTGIYPGSRERYVIPFPSIEATWTGGTVQVSASVLNGLGVTYLQPSTGLLWSLSLRPGPERTREGYSVMGFRKDHPEAVRSLLQSSTDASTPVAAIATVAMPTPVGLVGASLSYAPTRVTPAEPGTPEEIRHGVQYSAVYAMGLPLSERLAFAATAQLTYMSRGYARAWYAVERETPSLPAFAAGSSFQDAKVALKLDYRLGERTDLSFLGAGTWLLGDARRSPFTQARRSHDLVFQILHRL